MGFVLKNGRAFQVGGAVHHGCGAAALAFLTHSPLGRFLENGLIELLRGRWSFGE